MEKLEKKVSVSYTYDPERKELSCDVVYNGTRDCFRAVFDDHPHRQTIHDLVDGFVQHLQEKEERKMAEVIRKNLPYSLEVWERNERSLVGSDMEPIKLASWDEEFAAHSFWLVRQDGRPVLVEQAIGGSAEEDFWEAYELPKLEVLLNTLRI